MIRKKKQKQIGVIQIKMFDSHFDICFFPFFKKKKERKRKDSLKQICF